MATLHIEHAITDLETWLSAFSGFVAARRNAGVRSERVQQPVDDPGYIVVDLDFGTVEEAEAFCAFSTIRCGRSPRTRPR
jgi:hypothetical protein